MTTGGGAAACPSRIGAGPAAASAATLIFELDAMPYDVMERAMALFGEEVGGAADPPPARPPRRYPVILKCLLADASLRDQQQQSLPAQTAADSLSANQSFGPRGSGGIGPIRPVAGIGHPIPVTAAAEAPAT
jgi:hypothetical protein